MLVVDIVLYALIALYLENIMPGKVGSRSYFFILFDCQQNVCRFSVLFDRIV